MSAAKTSGGTFAPLAQPVFAVLWIATVLGNTGSFMRDVASSWLMTDLSASPAAVAMVQAAGTLPIFLLAIPAGVLTDILDRRKFLIAVQLLLASVSISLMVLSQIGMLSVSALIGLTFLGGIGAALMGPTWQAIVPELVKREDVKSAVALNSLGINIARSIGPDCWRFASGSVRGGDHLWRRRCKLHLRYRGSGVVATCQKRQRRSTRELLRRVQGWPTLHSLKPPPACRPSSCRHLLRIRQCRLGTSSAGCPTTAGW